MQFGREGATVVLTGRREALGASVAAAIVAEGGRAQFIPADHTRPEDCQQVVDATIAAHSCIDVLFNNAGVVLSGSAEATSEADWQRVFDLNVTAVWRMSRLVLPAMRAQGSGAIVNNASDWAVVGGRSRRMGAPAPPTSRRSCATSPSQRFTPARRCAPSRP